MRYIFVLLFFIGFIYSMDITGSAEEKINYNIMQKISSKIDIESINQWNEKNVEINNAYCDALYAAKQVQELFVKFKYDKSLRRFTGGDGADIHDELKLIIVYLSENDKQIKLIYDRYSPIVEERRKRIMKRLMADAEYKKAYELAEKNNWIKSPIYTKILNQEDMWLVDRYVSSQ